MTATREKKYLAHIRKSSDGKEILDEQTVAEHLVETAKRAEQFAAVFGAKDLGYCAGILHDIGKYSDKFQRRIRGGSEMVDHATAGAQLCWKRGGLYTLVAYGIAGHHAGLPDTGSQGDLGSDRTMLGRMKKKLEDCSAYEREIQVPSVENPPFMPGCEENYGFFLSVMARMLFSCLVDADFLDTEYFMQGKKTERDSGDSMEILFERLKIHVAEWMENKDLTTINGRRTEILTHCLSMGEEERGLFRLTVPTGGGKTVASLSFALRHAVKHGMKRVIYVVPYTSIIEQNARVFADICGEQNVLENHCNVDYTVSEELKPMQLAAENWDKPVVVTTSVQFFESLFSNKASKCRKLHNIADSVIIFDEAQMLPTNYLKPCVAVMEQLIRYYKSTLVLCTATQPALEKLFVDEFKEAKELCPRMEEQFSFFRRAKIQDMGQVETEELGKILMEQSSALCILNTRKTAQRLYELVKGDGVFHLSTSMYPVHRRRVLTEIRKRLTAGERCIVISTSLVEAGVDLDFQTVYRQLAGVDSIIQAAGRCNREGIHRLEDSVTWVFRLAEKEWMPGQRQQMSMTEILLKEGKALECPETIQEYFSGLYHLRREELDKKRILERFKQTGYFEFATAALEFKFIENDAVSILIPLEERASQVAAELRTQGFTRQRMREAGQFCVDVYRTILEKLQAAGAVSALSTDAEDFFVLTDMDRYDEKIGLRLDVEMGEAVIF